MSQLHLVFNVIKVFPAPEDLIIGHHTEHLPPPDLIDREEHFELEAILEKGYGYEHNSWPPEHDVAAKDLVQKFHQNHPNAPQRIQHTAFKSLAFWKIH